MTAMPDKDEKCRAVEQLIAGGKGVCESCRIIGISERTLARWRKDRRPATADLSPAPS
ncbi:helix-turn-helix domain-containing protein [Sphingomonas sp. 28-63-12]|uniref:helix-turn-helix domain-containing protein n=1 Tax=Sphingomonas sp. 28-63-12 TaxID=1970434 RepID=UPI000BC5D737|nr:MAG: hypothetical protein B7Y47_15865 [Sphingomonas sp. 28-63-12]